MTEMRQLAKKDFKIALINIINILHGMNIIKRLMKHILKIKNKEKAFCKIQYLFVIKI